MRKTTVLRIAEMFTLTISLELRLTKAGVEVGQLTPRFGAELS